MSPSDLAQLGAREAEIKVRLTKDEFDRLRSCLGNSSRRIIQTNYYFDSPQGHLDKAEVYLRVREEFDPTDKLARFLMTVKGPSMSAGALMIRTEVEAFITSDAWSGFRFGTLRFADVDLPPVKKLREMVPTLDEIDLNLLGRVENLREVFSFEVDSISLELELDTSRYPDGSTSFEVEAEVSQKMAGIGARALRSLFDELGVAWKPSEGSKHDRFRQRLPVTLGFKSYETLERTHISDSARPKLDGLSL